MTARTRTCRTWIVAIALAALATTAHAQVEPTLDQLAALRGVLAP
jgi:hypothetical protein